MKYESWNIAVEGQKTGEAVLHGYLLDAISVAPEKKRPAVIVCAGGGYARRSDREAEPVILQFLYMGYWITVLHRTVFQHLSGNWLWRFPWFGSMPKNGMWIQKRSLSVDFPQQDISAAV